MNNALPLISLVIPCKNEEKYISICIDSLLANDYPKEKMEFFVVDGMSKDKTREIINEYSIKNNFIKLLDNPDIITPKAMNIGVKASSGDYIIILSAHTFYPTDYISKLIEWHGKLDADNIGGLFVTDVKNKTKKSSAIIKVLSNKFGVGNNAYRTGADKPKIVDTAAFGCYKKEVFNKIGLYDERLVRNQDIEFNKRLSNNGGKTYLVPEIKCTYYARETFTELAKNNFGNGLWILRTVFLTKTFKSLSLRHFIPLLFVLSLTTPIIFSYFNNYLIYISLISFLIYNIFILIISFIELDKSTKYTYLLKTFYVLHFSYGFGTLLGIFTLFNKTGRIKNG